MDSTVRILLVEDNRDDEELAVRALRRANLANQIDVVRDGAEALDFIFGSDGTPPVDFEHPAVVLLDLKLPKVDGLEVLRRIKSHERTRRLPVVILTSSREERDLIESYDLGVNSYIVKPIDFEQFNRAIAEIGHYWLVVNQRPSSS